METTQVDLALSAIVAPAHRRVILGRLAAAAMVFSVVTGACTASSQGGTAAQSSSSEPTATQRVHTDPTASPSDQETIRPAQGLDKVKAATIRIEADGTFVDPQQGLFDSVGKGGSGFIIDSDGIAVTNNHVVTGAAFINVWVGDDKEPRRARVLGASECSDLAVIDIDGDNYPTLDWRHGDTEVGLDVYAAGFPFFNPEFTLNRGIVSKAEANGDSSWASVDSVLEHDAKIDPGNSGGPLVDASGAVVGINYAANNADQHFAIAEREAKSILTDLRAGHDVNSIGINGVAVTDGKNLTGIWVRSVKAGSPADATGIQPGDILTRLENFALATDGTMKDYCSILHGHNADATMNVQVLRFATGEVLEGQLNGRELEQVASTSGATTNGSTDSNSASGYTYTTLQNGRHSITVSTPSAWKDHRTGSWVAGSRRLGSALAASTSVPKWLKTWKVPGFFIGASRSMRHQSIARVLREGSMSGSCHKVARRAYGNSRFIGSYDLYNNCGAEKSTFFFLVAKPASGAYLLEVQMIIRTDADWQALDQLLKTLRIRPSRI